MVHSLRAVRRLVALLVLVFACQAAWTQAQDGEFVRSLLLGDALDPELVGAVDEPLEARSNIESSSC